MKILKNTTCVFLFAIFWLLYLDVFYISPLNHVRNRDEWGEIAPLLFQKCILAIWVVKYEEQENKISLYCHRRSDVADWVKIYWYSSCMSNLFICLGPHHLILLWSCGYIHTLYRTGIETFFVCLRILLPAFFAAYILWKCWTSILIMWGILAVRTIKRVRIFLFDIFRHINQKKLIQDTV